MLLQTPPISSYQLKKHIPSSVVMNNNVPTIIYEYTHSQDFGIIAAKHLARESAGQNFCLVPWTFGGQVLPKLSICMTGTSHFIYMPPGPHTCLPNPCEKRHACLSSCTM